MPTSNQTDCHVTRRQSWSSYWLWLVCFDTFCFSSSVVSIYIYICFLVGNLICTSWSLVYIIYFLCNACALSFLSMFMCILVLLIVLINLGIFTLFIFIFILISQAVQDFLIKYLHRLVLIEHQFLIIIILRFRNLSFHQMKRLHPIYLYVQ